jgi:transcriptional regulator NrdR family protein
MVCITCGLETQIINSRLQKRANSVWRRRRCLHCSAIFTTREQADLSALWRVQINNLDMEPFSRDRLLLSLYKSLQHRPTAINDAGGLTDTIISELRPLSSSGLLPRQQIITTATQVLARFDTVASNLYQAYHKR